MHCRALVHGCTTSSSTEGAGWESLAIATTLLSSSIHFSLFIHVAGGFWREDSIHFQDISAVQAILFIFNPINVGECVV